VSVTSTVIEGEDDAHRRDGDHPGPGNLYTHPVPAWVHVGNGYGKLIGETQIREFGEIETPILLTCTLCVWRAADALKEWVYEQPGMGEHTRESRRRRDQRRPRQRHVGRPDRRDEVFAALERASTGPVEEGSVGAGTGTQAFGYKGGIGTSSRVLPEALGGWTDRRARADELRRLHDHRRRAGRALLGRYPYADALEADRTRTARTARS
jgi:D-aminopeptidase